MISSDPIAIAVLIGTFFGLIISGFPIAFAIGVSTVITTLYLGIPLQSVFLMMVSLVAQGGNRSLRC